jgi:catechol 2,3-dioxygenase-like lactoylglutathione lyase family enzyme
METVLENGIHTESVTHVIHALDCITLGVTSPDGAAQSYSELLGRALGAERAPACMQLANVRLEFVAKASSADEGLAGVAFAVDDLAKARHLLERRAMRVHLAGGDGGTGAGRLHLATDSTHGVPVSLVERQSEAARSGPALVAADADAAVSGLDHVVIRTPNPERAVALYAGRLGLSLRLDRSEPSWGARLLFFRCGDLVIEVAHDLKAGVGDAPDKLWGLSWRVPDIARAHARVKAAGIDVSDMRTGRRPGTRLFTVRSHTAGVPTIMIGPDTPAAA